jgi:trk system potassium uptake protein TrkA
MNRNHHRILHKLGADHIVHPEHEMGMRLAHSMMYPEVIDYIGLGHDQFVVEVRASDKLAGKTASQLQLAAHGVQLLLIKHHGDVMTRLPDDYAFRQGDQLVLTGTLANLRSIAGDL